jgi:3-deoxy-D-manno-octulosonic-acid transferase
VQRLEGILNEAGIATATLNEVESEAEPSLAPAIIVDRVGVLAQLYTLGSAAFVGGGFGRRGLHSVIEPAALGCAVVFGPHPGNAREAVQLEAAGGGTMVRNTAELEQAIRRLLNDAAPGRNAREFVRQRLGAGARIASLIAEAISRTGRADRTMQERISEGG